MLEFLNIRISLKITVKQYKVINVSCGITNCVNAPPLIMDYFFDACKRTLGHLLFILPVFYLYPTPLLQRQENMSVECVLP